MSYSAILAVLAISVVMTGCQTQSTPPPAQPAHYQRFVPIPADVSPTQGVPWHGYFALDTKTGTLCKTLTFTKEMPEWTNGVPVCSQILARDKD